MLTPAQKKNNLRTGLILASVAVAFFIGFLVKMVVLSRH
ncbi:cytochrome oxidase small assembly protein [Rhodoferax sp. OV413]|nr:cytochrome oxidase small assembly protein [Rhodoferax sp. OV413]